MPHNSPQAQTRRRDYLRAQEADGTARSQCQARLAVGGAMIQVQAAMRPTGRHGGGKRGKVAGFSKGSRQRLLRMLASINRERMGRLPLFVTLTYPAAWPGDWKRWKRDIDTLGKWLCRVRPLAGVVWRMEYQERGAPHFHLLVFGAGYIPHKAVARAWYRIVASGDEKHLLAGVQVKQVQSWRGVMSYASKYMGKVGAGATNEQEAGRMWGVWHPENLPTDVITVLLTWRAFYRAKRAVRALWRARDRAGKGGWPRKGKPPPYFNCEYVGFSLFGEGSTLIALLCAGTATSSEYTDRPLGQIVRAESETAKRNNQTERPATSRREQDVPRLRGAKRQDDGFGPTV